MEVEQHVDFEAEFKKSLADVISHRPWQELNQIEKDERDHVITYEFVTNDGSDASLMQLVHCKCLFGRQLPKMPKEYIVRLVFDRRHFCLVMKKKEVVGTTPPSESVTPSESGSSHEVPPTTGRTRETVVAAVCFRPFHTFAEIAFLAVSSKDQVRGYGTRLMNHLKESLKRRGVTDLVTYADNAAVGYFSKQGFYSPTTSQATKPDSQWHTCIKTGYDSYIKDYDGANKMVCCIYKEVNYLTLSTMREEVQAAIWETFLKVHPKMRVFKGLDRMPDKLHEIPGFEYLGPSAPSSPPVKPTRADEQSSPPRNRPISSRLQVPTSMESMVSDVLESALSHGSSWPFKQPVDVNLAPDYYDVIRNPMDIATMKDKNSRGEYKSLKTLKEDFKLMFDNCLFYNGDDSVYAQAAQVLEKAVMGRIERLEQMTKHK